MSAVLILIIRILISLAWAEMYIVLAALIRRFDFQFFDTKAEDFEVVSDQFVTGIRGNGLLEAHVQICAE